MSNPKPRSNGGQRSSTTSRGRSVSPSHETTRKARSKSAAARKRSKSSNRDHKRRGRSKSKDDRSRVHQKDSRSKSRPSRSKSTNARNGSSRRHHHKEDDSSQGQHNHTTSGRRGSGVFARGTSVRRHLSVDGLNKPPNITRMRRSKSGGNGMTRSKSMSMTNNWEVQEEEPKPRRAGRRSSVTNTGRPTLSKELQNRRSVRRLQVEEMKTKERIQNAIFDKALAKTKSSRYLNEEEEEEEEEVEVFPSRITVPGSNRRMSCTGPTPAASTTMKRPVSRRATMNNSGGGGAMMMRKAPSYRRVTRSKSYDGVEDPLQRIPRRRPSRSDSSALKRAASSRQFSSNDPLEEVPPLAPPHSLADKLAPKQRGLSSINDDSLSLMSGWSNDDDFFQAEAAAKSGGIVKQAEEEETDTAFHALAKTNAAARRLPNSKFLERTASRRQLVTGDDESSMSEEEQSMTEYNEDQSESGMFNDSDSVLEVKQPIRRMPPTKINSKSSTTLQRALSSRHQWLEHEKSVQRDHIRSQLVFADDSYADPRVTEEADEEQSLTEFAEGHSESIITFNDSDSVLEVKQPNRRMPPKSNSKSTALQGALSKRGKSLRDLFDEEKDQERATKDEPSSKAASKSAFLQKAAQGKALLEKAKSEKKYKLEDTTSLAASDQQSFSSRRRSSATNLKDAANGPPHNHSRPGLYDKKSQGSRRTSRTSLGLLELSSNMDASHTTCQSGNTRSTVSTSASSRSSLSRSSKTTNSTESLLSRASSRTSSSTESLQRVKDLRSQFWSNKSLVRPNDTTRVANDIPLLEIARVLD